MNWLRTRENAAFAKGLMFGKAVGAKDARQSIIELLDECVCGASVEKCMTCECDQRKIKRADLIALIKGENK